MGPPSRPRSCIEDHLLKKLDKALSKEYSKSDIIYIPCFGHTDDSGEYIFLEDNIHLSPAGHKKFAQLLYSEIKNLLAF